MKTVNKLELNLKVNDKDNATDTQKPSDHLSSEGIVDKDNVTDTQESSDHLSSDEVEGIVDISSGHVDMIGIQAQDFLSIGGMGEIQGIPGVVTEEIQEIPGMVGVGLEMSIPVTTGLKKSFLNQEFDNRAKNFAHRIESFTAKHIDKKWRKTLSNLLGTTDFDRESLADDLKKTVVSSVETRNAEKCREVLINFNRILNERSYVNLNKEKKEKEETVKNDTDELQEFLEQHKNLLNVLGDKGEKLLQYIQLNKEFTSMYNDLCKSSNRKSMVLINTISVINTLNENLAITGQKDYKKSIKQLITSLGMEDQLDDYLKLICQKEMLKPCLQREYQLKCNICHSHTSEKNRLQVFDPCGHICCTDCTTNLKEIYCPFCRKTYFKFIKIYN